RRDLKRREASHGLGCIFDVVAVKAQQVAGILQLVKHRAAVDVLHRVQAEFEGRHHAEVAATTTDGPEQVRVLLFAGDEKLSIRGHNVGGNQVVERQAVPAGEVSDATAEGQTRDSCGRDDAA